MRRWSTSSSWVVSATRSRNWRTRGCRLSSDFLDRPHGGDVAAVDQNHPVGDQEGARQFVRHHHHAHRVCLFEAQDQIVDAGGGDGVEAGGRFVEEQDLGVERHGARERRALLHASAELRGAVILEPAQPHLLQFDPHHHFDGGGLRAWCVPAAAARYSRPPSGADQRAALKCQADFLANVIHLARGSLGDVDAFDVHLPEDGFSRPTSVRSRVLLPEPEPPITTMVSPCATSKVRPCRISRSPYCDAQIAGRNDWGRTAGAAIPTRPPAPRRTGS